MVKKHPEDVSEGRRARYSPAGPPAALPRAGTLPMSPRPAAPHWGCPGVSKPERGACAGTWIHLFVMRRRLLETAGEPGSALLVPVLCQSAGKALKDFH